MSKIVVDVQKLFSIWHTAMSNAEICLEIGVSRTTLDSLRHRYKLPRRPRIMPKRLDVEENDPSHEEIESRAAEIRAGWSEEEEQRRIVGKKQVRWSTPRYSFDGRDAAFAGISH